MKKKMMILSLVIFIMSALWGATLTFERVEGVANVTTGFYVIGNVSGDKVNALSILKAKSAYYMMTEELDLNVAGDEVSTAEHNVIWHVRNHGTYLTFQAASTGRYLTYTGKSTSLNLVVTAEQTKTRWNLSPSSIPGGNDFTVNNLSPNTRLLRFRGDLAIPRFAAYLSTTPHTQNDVSFFRLNDQDSMPVIKSVYVIDEIPIEGSFITFDTDVINVYQCPVASSHTLQTLDECDNCSKVYLRHTFFNPTNNTDSPDDEVELLLIPVYAPELTNNYIFTFNAVVHGASNNLYGADGSRSHLQVVVRDSENFILVSSELQTFFVGNTPIQRLKRNIPSGEYAGYPFFEDYFVKFRGIATTADGFISPADVTDFYMQDGAYGMGVWNQYEKAENVVIGVEYVVTGFVTQYRGKTEVFAVDVRPPNTGEFAIPLTAIAVHNMTGTSNNAALELLESRLVSFNYTKIGVVTGETTEGVFTTDGSAAYPFGGTPAHIYHNVSISSPEIQGDIVVRIPLPSMQALGVNVYQMDDAGVIVGVIEQHDHTYVDGDDETTVTRYRVLVRNVREVFEEALALSVTLPYFNARVTNNDNVNIVWETASGNNLRGFHVLRGDSNNLFDATPITDLINAVNTTLTQRYSFTDNQVSTNGEYWYWIRMVDNSGITTYSERYAHINVKEGGIDDPVHYTSVQGVFPNPMRVGTPANFDVKVKENETAVLRIFNVRGQLVRDFEVNRTGNVAWDLKDANNREVSSGVYFYQLISPSAERVQRMVIVR